MGMQFKFNIPPKKIAADRVTDQLQLFLANECRKLMKPYVPELNHMLTDNVRTYVDGGKGVVHYMSPYARYQYNGLLMVSSKTGSAWSRGEKKIVTKKPLKYSKATATSKWDKAMWSARKDEITKAAQNFIKRGGE